MKVIEAIGICPECNAPLPAGPLLGLCPACLLDSSLLNLEEESAAPQSAELPTPGNLPQCLGRYQLTSEIARGGMSIVFRARDEALHRDVAIKILHAGPLASREAVRRLFLEARATARLHHPNILPIYEVGGAESQPFIAMPLLEGGTLATRIRDGACRLADPAEIARLLRKISLAVHHAHRHGILHRDLKPGNILFDSADEPLVGDFGLVRVLEEDSTITISQAVLGTPAYMSPEQARGDGAQLTVAADIYGLGGILYEQLAGCPPFSGASVAEVLRKVQEEEPVAPLERKSETRQTNSSLAARHSPRLRDLETICLKCLEKEPSSRYATAQDLADDLGRFLNDEPILARPIGATARLWRWCRRRPAVAALSAGLALALLAGFAGTLWQLNEARQHAAENRRQIASLHVLNGVNLMQEGDHFRSLLWFADALALNADSPGQAAVNRSRIASIIDQGPRLVAVITHDGQPVGDAAFNPVQDQLATVGRDRRLRVWEIPTGRMLFMTEPFDESPSDVQFAPDGARILLTSSEFNHTRLIATSNGEPPLSPGGGEGGRRPGEGAAASSGTGILPAKSVIGPIPHFAGGANNQPLPPGFDKTGKLLLTQSAPKTVRVWSSLDASPQGPAITLDAPIAWMNFSQDGGQVLAITQDGRMTAWDWKTGEEVALPFNSPRSSGRESAPVSGFENQSRLMSAATVKSPDGTRFATISADHRARVWSTDTGKPLTPPLDHKLSAGLVEFSATGRYIFTIHPAHAVFVWDLFQTGEPPVLLRPSPPDTLAESGQDGSAFVTRDPNSPIRVRTLSGPSEVSLHPSSLKEIPVQAWFDKTGEFIVLEGEKMRAQVWDAATGLPVTPVFQTRYATNETDYLTVKLPTFPLAPTGGEGRGEGAASQSQIANRKSRMLTELLSGSRLDGTGGWKPLELGEIVARWNELNHPPFANGGNK